MAAIVVSQGLQRIGKQSSQTTGYSAVRQIQVMSVDDGTVAFAAGHTALNSGGAVTNEFDQAFDSTPTIAAQTVTHVITLATGSLCPQRR